MAPPNVLKFPAKNNKDFQRFFRGKGVPECAFHYRKLDLGRITADLIWENPKKRVYKLSSKKQLDYFDKIVKDPFQPRLVVVGTGEGGDGYIEASRLVFWLFHRAYKKRESVAHREPLWYRVYNNRDDRLLRVYKDDIERTSSGIEAFSFLVLDNLYPNSSPIHINKTQDLIDFYRDKMTVIAIIHGINAYEFAETKLYTNTNMAFHITQRSTVIL